MSTPSKMNIFLQRMLRKNDDEVQYNDEIVVKINHQQVEYSPKKSTWIQKLTASPNKSYKSLNTQPITPPVWQTDPMPIQRSTTFPTPREAQDLGNIIKDFETNYLSPMKQITQQDTDKTGKFVKKMVAAFEQKYKNSREPTNEVITSRLKRRSLPSVSAQHQEARKNFFNETYLIKPAPPNLDDTIDLNNSCDVLDSTLDLTRSFTMKEDLSSTPLRPPVPPNTPLKASTSPQPILDTSRTPKIVGAFLKKPIEVEDTSIDWIPITGKKLPRKNSFKKLLSILTGKKSSSKGSKFFCSQSQNNLHEESPKDSHDSGYEEKSSSTSSLTSLASFSAVFQTYQHQDNFTSELNKRSSVSTFQTPKDIEDSIETEDVFSDTESLKSSGSKKFIFEEIPRSEVRLSLGPSFPLKGGMMRQFSGSSIASENIDDFDDLDLDSDTTPVASPLPKHPFVSSKDDLDKDSDCDVKGNLGNVLDSSKSSGVSSNDITQVEFRHPSWKFKEDNDVYDTPRSYLSMSEPGLFNSSARSSNWSFEGPVYDIPVVKVPPRPKSSVYEDALSLKRRNAHVSCAATKVRSQYYAFPSEEEPHYATVKPRNIKILPSKDLLRSMANIPPNCKTPVSHYLAFDRLAGF